MEARDGRASGRSLELPPRRMTPAGPRERTSDTSDRFPAASTDPWARSAVSKLNPAKLGETGLPLEDWSIVSVAVSSATARLLTNGLAERNVAQQAFRMSRRELPGT